MNKICVYAIAKNEAKNVRQWYDSMREADLIIVLDTGSTDNTVKLLQECGVTVYEKHYDTFAFDIARNDALALIPQEYNILISTDLDEVFEPGWAKPLREQWIEGKHERCQYAYTWDHLSDGSNGHTFIYNKIHTRNWHWRDAIHETLCKIEDNSRDYTSGQCLDLYDTIHLHHYQDLTVDRDWYVHLCEQRVERSPLDKYGWLELIREYCAKKMHNKCIELGNKLTTELKDLFDEIDIASIYHQQGLSYSQIGKTIPAIGAYTNGICACIQYRENYLELANVYLQCGLYEMAIGVVQEAFRSTQELKHWTESAMAYSWALYDVISIAYYNLGDYVNAYSYSSMALSFEPTHPELLEKNKAFFMAMQDSLKNK